MRESSTYQAILEEGREEGRDEGITLGSVRTRQEDLLALLRERFQTVPPEVEAKVRGATDLARLQAAMLRVLHISAPDELPL